MVSGRPGISNELSMPNYTFIPEYLALPQATLSNRYKLRTYNRLISNKEDTGLCALFIELKTKYSLNQFYQAIFFLPFT
jgi:hypothetical protein